jgi:hypothetical protein
MCAIEWVGKKLLRPVLWGEGGGREKRSKRRKRGRKGGGKGGEGNGKKKQT